MPHLLCENDRFAKYSATDSVSLILDTIYLLVYIPVFLDKRKRFCYNYAMVFNRARA